MRVDNQRRLRQSRTRTNGAHHGAATSAQDRLTGRLTILRDAAGAIAGGPRCGSAVCGFPRAWPWPQHRNTHRDHAGGGHQCRDVLWASERACTVHTPTRSGCWFGRSRGRAVGLNAPTLPTPCPIRFASPGSRRAVCGSIGARLSMLVASGPGGAQVTRLHCWRSSPLASLAARRSGPSADAGYCSHRESAPPCR
jgi:hypothetical protein